MRKCLITGLMALFVLTGLAFGQDYDEVFTTGWMAADEDGDGTPDWESIYMWFLRDVNGDGNANFCITKSSDEYYTDWTTSHADFYGADFNPFWTIEDASVAPRYLTHADIDGDGKIEIVFTGRDNETSDLTEGIVKSLVEVYDVGSQVPEWDYVTQQGMEIIGMTGPSYRFDNDAIPDLLLLGDWFRSYDTYLFRSTAADAYELLWQSQSVVDERVLVPVDYDFDGDLEILLCELEDQSQTECELKLYDYDPGTDRIVRDRIWYRSEVLVLPDQVSDMDGDGSPELLLRTWDSQREGYNLKLIDGDSEEELFSYGEQLLGNERVSGAVIWEDGLGGHDLDMDGNAEILYMARLYEVDEAGVNRIIESNCFVAEYEGGTFVTRFEEDTSVSLKGIEVRDLDADGMDELCLSFFIRETSGYRYEFIVYDPMNGYQEKFRIVLDDHQFIPYYAPLQYGGVGVDIDGDGVGEFLMLDYEWLSQTEGQYAVQIRDGATGALKWEEQYGRGVYVGVDWATEERTSAGIIYPSTDLNGNGKLDFGISEFQLEDDELIAARHTIFEYGVPPPVLEIWVETDKADYRLGDTIELRIGGQNTGVGRMVDVYIAIVKSDGSIHCAPSWLPGIEPWIPNFMFPGGFSMLPAPFFTFTLPCDLPPINTPGDYFFAGALTPPGEFDFLSLGIAEFTFQKMGS